MRNSPENLQHRRHRPMYLAPSATHLQQFSGRRGDLTGSSGYEDDDCYLYQTSSSGDSSYNSGWDGDGGDHDDDDSYEEDLRIPVFVEIPEDEDLRFPIVSPPTSNDSNNEGLLLTSLIPQPQRRAFQSQSTFSAPRPQQQQRIHDDTTESSRLSSCRHRLCRTISWLYSVVSDFFLLIFVCVIGLFFHVEVQVVKHTGGSGRVIIQNHKNNNHSREITRSVPRRHYHSSDLLRPLQSQSTVPNQFWMGDDMV